MRKKHSHEMEEAFIAFIRANRQRFYFLAYSYTKNEQDALDIVQDSIQKAMQALHRLEHFTYIKSWFYKIVVRTAIDFLRKNKRLQVTDDAQLEHFIPAYEDDYTDFDLTKALDALPLKYREVIILHYFEDLTLADVAIVLNVNINTIKSRLYRALQLLKIDLQEEETTDE
ncbi:RNA polymerase sigma factor SigV [Lysinibacillus alkalisoli]|uniref:RNA polymerase sigma factor SigV n=1 Tax=Lysinibacillus alkalisoli TaxID=1911548 RepID=A0A917G004_9BACI|nr:sigma-70 family RNA polymerase sigma factor [Lysinibacillus alkalisoli]GGG15611.1 RNA polymerase sigma factor SigV [Lysinibacillus alkalisoli]